MTLLSINNLSKILRKKKILSSISFNADGGQIVVILGPNGAGKTTLLKTVMGLHPLTNQDTKEQHGTITFDQVDINGAPVHRRVEQGLLYLPQHSSLFQHLSVSQNLDVVYHYHTQWKNQTYAQFQEEVDRLLELTHLSATRNQIAETLSGGQKRKLEVVRSLLMKPKMLLLDEPFAGVDPKSIYELKNIFTTMANDGIGVVISDHHVDQLLSIANMVYVIVGGRVVSSGSIQEILENTYTKESYLGTQFHEEMSQRYL